MVLIQLNATIINSSSQLGEEKQPCRNGNAYVEKRCIGVINIKKCIIDIQEKFSLNMFHNKMYECTHKINFTFIVNIIQLSILNRTHQYINTHVKIISSSIVYLI